MRFVVNKILRIIGSIVIGALALMALFLLLLHLLSPNLQGYKADLERYVSQMMQQPVQIGRLDVGVHNFEPVLSLHDSKIFARDAKTQLITVQELQVGIDIFGSLVRWHIVPGLLVVKGTSLSLHQDASGDVKVLDLQASAGTNAYADKTPFLQWLLTQGKIELEDLTLSWQPYQGSAIKLSNLDLVLINRFAMHELHLAGRIKQVHNFGSFLVDLKIHGDILQHEDLSLAGEIKGQDLIIPVNFAGSSHNIFTAIHDGDVWVQGKNLQLDFGKLFRQPIWVGKYYSAVIWQQTNNGTSIQINKIKLGNKQIFLTGSCGLSLPQVTPADPQIDLRTKFSLVDIPNVKSYFPITVIPPNALAWLDQAFIAGTKVSGSFLLQGHLNQYPFAQGGGHFLIDSYVQNINLHYQNNWPRIDNIYGKLIFENQGMRVNIDSAKIMSWPTMPIQAEIKDLSDPVLEVKGKVNTDASNGLRFIAASPLQNSVGRDLKGIAFSGPIQLQLQLHMPLGTEISKHDTTHVAGQINFRDNQLQLTDWNLALQQFSGVMQFTEDSLTANNLTAMLLQQPVQINIATQDSTKDNFITRITLIGKTAISDIQNVFAVKLAPYLSGVLNYKAIVTMHHNRKVDNSLTLTTDLQGVTVDLPEPFAKAGNAAMASSFSYYFGNSKIVRQMLIYGDKLSAALTFNKLEHDGLKLIGGEVKLNAQDATWQQQAGIAVRGKMDKVVWAYWQDYFTNKLKATKSTIPIREVRLFIKQLEAFGQELADVELQLVPQNSANVWLLGLRNANIVGNLLIPFSGLNRQIRGTFAKIYITESSKKQITEIKPQSVPPLSIEINDFHYGEKNLGKVEFATEPLVNSMQIKRLAITTSEFAINANGNWSGVKKSQQTTLAGKFSSQDIGAMLKRLDIASSLIGGNTAVNFELNWLGAPFEPALRKLNGAFSIYVQHGRIINLGAKAEAGLGFGRVLSLLSLQTLPRRLTLDFSDLTKSGFSFDSLRGNAEMRNGDVFTNNIKLEGPVAQVLVKGRIGLVAEDYNILLQTIPHVTSSIPVIATIAGGPIVGAATWLAEKVVGSQVGKVSTYTYRISGSWSDPQITKQ